MIELNDLEYQLASNDWQVQLEAIDGLTQLILETEDEETVEQARADIQRLAAAPATLDSLVTALFHVEQRIRYLAAMETINQLGEEAIPYLLDLMAEEAELGREAELVDFLLTVSPEVAGSFLWELVVNPTSEAVQMAALRGFSQLDEPEWIPALLPQLEQTEGVLRRQTLATLVSVAAFQEEAYQELYPVLFDLNEDNDPEIAGLSLLGLGWLSVPEAPAYLRSWWEQADEWADLVLLALALHDDPIPSEVIQQALTHPDWFIRVGAVGCAVASGDAVLIEQVLSQAQADEEEIVRWSAELVTPYQVQLPSYPEFAMRIGDSEVDFTADRHRAALFLMTVITQSPMVAMLCGVLLQIEEGPQLTYLANALYSMFSGFAQFE